MKINLPKIITIIGPTASGKTKLAIDLAKQFNGEIVSADSRQFYRGMDIGTAKVSKQEMDGIAHHLIDIKNPNDKFTLYDFQKLAFQVIDDIIARGKMPIMVGGTGMYVSAIVDNYQLSDKEPDLKLRQELNAKELDDLVAQLKEREPDLVMDFKNKRRVVRALENSINDYDHKAELGERRHDVLVIQPFYERENLYSKIDQRVEDMIKDVLIDEVKLLVKKFGWEAQAMNAIGYREFQGFDLDDLSAEALNGIIEKIKQNSRNFAKRQITWFRRYEEGTNIVHNPTEAIAVVNEWLNLA